MPAYCFTILIDAEVTLHQYCINLIIPYYQTSFYAILYLRSQMCNISLYISLHLLTKRQCLYFTMLIDFSI